MNNINEKDPYLMLKKLTVEKENLEDQIRVLCSKEEELERDIMKVKYEIAILESAFTNAPWKISQSQLSKQNSITIYSDGKKHERLATLIQEDYHSRQLLEKGIVVSFSDLEIYLNFESIDIAKEFIQRVGIKLDTKSIEDSAVRAQNEVDKLNYFLNEINALQGK